MSSRSVPRPAARARNFRHTTTTDTVADNVNLRVTHSCTPAAGGRGAGGGGGMGRPGGRGWRGDQGTSVVMNAQIQYRRSDNEQNHVFPSLGGTTEGSTFSAPVGLQITRRDTMHRARAGLPGPDRQTRSSATAFRPCSTWRPAVCGPASRSIAARSRCSTRRPSNGPPSTRQRARSPSRGWRSTSGAAERALATAPS